MPTHPTSSSLTQSAKLIHPWLSAFHHLPLQTGKLQFAQDFQVRIGNYGLAWEYNPGFQGSGKPVFRCNCKLRFAENQALPNDVKSPKRGGKEVTMGEREHTQPRLVHITPNHGSAPEPIDNSLCTIPYLNHHI